DVPALTPKRGASPARDVSPGAEPTPSAEPTNVLLSEAPAPAPKRSERPAATPQASAPASGEPTRPVRSLGALFEEEQPQAERSELVRSHRSAPDASQAMVRQLPDEEPAEKAQPEPSHAVFDFEEEE
ncbi:MAG: hypothetical protein JWM85_1970, partial [Acidimicrobiaceae bacterium]|nr:hypothetical protein [Acidimicrobiaceae bacterium]